MDKLNFSIDAVNMIAEISDSQLALMEIYVCHDGMNLHEKPISLDTMEQASETLYNKFLVAGFNGVDFEGHEPDERIVGFFPKENKLRYEVKNGKNYLVAQAMLSKIYAQWAYDIFLDENTKRGVSMEITVLETQQKSDGYEWITSFVFNGVTLLGEDIKPACPDSDARVFKFSEKKCIDECQKIYNSLDFVAERYKHIDFKIPQEVKDRAKYGLELRKKYKRGGTSVGIATAKYLVNNDEATPEKVRHIAKYFPRHAGDNLDDNDKDGDPPSNGFVAWLLWGDDAGRRWSNKIVRQMNKADEEEMSYEEDFKIPIGEGDYSLKVNKDKNVVSEDSWGEIDKTILMRKVLNSKNSDSIVEDVYGVVEEGWKDSPSSKLKYPLMQIKNGELVYNKGALKSAQGYAESQGLESLVNKIKKIRMDLGLIEEDMEEVYDMGKMEMMNEISKMECMNKYRILDMADDMGMVYFIDMESKEMYGAPVMMEEEGMKVMMEDMKTAMMMPKYQLADDEDKDVYMEMFSLLEVKTNRIDFTYENKREKLRCKIKEMMPEMDYFWIEDFDDEYVYVSCEGVLKRYMYDAEYNLDMNSMVKVVRQTEYMEFNADANIEAEAQTVQQELEDENMKEQMQENGDLEKIEVPRMEGIEDDSKNMMKMGEDLKEIGYSIEDVKELIAFKNNVLEAERKQKIEFACQAVSKDLTAEQISEWRSKVEEFENFTAWENALKSFAYDESLTKEEEGITGDVVRYAWIEGNEGKSTDSGKKWWEH